jgi:hypothetical protein
MLQVARLAPKQLGESRDLVAAFLHNRVNPDGAFRNRAGVSDLYYTVFGLEGLVALQEQLPATARSYVEHFGDGEQLDLVHLACLARCWANVSRDLDGVPSREILARIEAYRSRDGGYGPTPAAPHGTVYSSFLALGAYEDLRAALPWPDRLRQSLAELRSKDGAYTNQPGENYGVTTVTAAAILLLRHLDGSIDPQLGMWLLDRCHSSGGFLATPHAPVPDLLSTATALHALQCLHVPIAGLREACLDFVDTLWTNRGGFYASWIDDAPDCEYTYYGLLALGHLTVAGA